MIEPLHVPGLKQACITRLEGLILSGEWQIGARLPAERDLALSLNISRPVLHEALVDLAAKGLVSIEPRRGVYVQDFRTSGSCALLTSLLTFNGGRLDPAFVQSLFDVRRTIECDAAARAAFHRQPEHLEQFALILSAEQDLSCANPAVYTERDFSFHLLVSIASGNLIYPLVINSFKSVYTHLTGQFFHQHCDSPVVRQVFTFHRQLVAHVTAGQSGPAAAVMEEMLQYGERHLDYDDMPAGPSRPSSTHDSPGT
ncbi:MAG: FadR family transcriptional regulator [Chloroflexi bacterium]|nr:FadR family transcriptional regulator [Chloroflexota bacterium]